MESNIEKRLVRGVRQLGGEAYKFISPGRSGVPDRIVILPEGQILFAELKTETGRLSPAQLRQVTRMRELGARVVVLYGMDDVTRFLEEVAG